MKIIFFVDSAPVPQPRQRHRLIGGAKPFVQNYTPTAHPVTAFKSVVQMRARQAYQGAPLAGPLRVSLLFLMPRPQRLIWKTKPMPREWAAKPIDTDNLFKSCADALTGIIWIDDGQVCDSSTQKMYHAGDESPGVHVEIETL